MRASYMLWLKARSLMALGITTATRNFSTGAAVAGAPAPQALRTIESARTRVKNQAIFFIFFSLLNGYDSFTGIIPLASTNSKEASGIIDPVSTTMFAG